MFFPATDLDHRVIPYEKMTRVVVCKTTFAVREDCSSFCNQIKFTLKSSMKMYVINRCSEFCEYKTIYSPIVYMFMRVVSCCHTSEEYIDHCIEDKLYFHF